MAFTRFADREDAGRRLVAQLNTLGLDFPLVLAIPRGGLPVARAIASEMNAKLDLAPSPDASADASFSGLTADRAGADAGISPRGRDIILVDDGATTGAMAVAAAKCLKARGASRVVFACPVVSSEAMERLAAEGAETCVLHVTEHMPTIGEYYVNFEPVSEAEVQRVHQKAKQQKTTASSGIPTETRPRDVHLELPSVTLQATLTVPRGARGIVVFAHGNGSSRHSPRNQKVAHALNDAYIGTLLLDLLTEEEERDRDNIFDIELLGHRIRHATEWLGRQKDICDLSVGYFGASTGAAAAIVAAAALPEKIRAVVSRGGRPDLAANYLASVSAPTLFIVGAKDEPVLSWNRKAYEALLCEKAFATVEGATHLFEEPGALDEVIRAACNWFERYLGPAGWTKSARTTSATDSPKR